MEYLQISLLMSAWYIQLVERSEERCYISTDFLSDECFLELLVFYLSNESTLMVQCHFSMPYKFNKPLLCSKLFHFWKH